MRQILLLFLCAFAFSCMGQSRHDCHKDTISSMSVPWHKNMECHIIETKDFDKNGEWVDSTWRITISIDTIQMTIHLPISDEDIKNFSVKEIKANRNVIVLCTSQGGGNFLIQRFFIFKSFHRQFYLNKVVTQYTSFESKRITKEVDRYHRKLQLSELYLLRFL